MGIPITVDILRTQLCTIVYKKTDYLKKFV